MSIECACGGDQEHPYSPMCGYISKKKQDSAYIAKIKEQIEEMSQKIAKLEKQPKPDTKSVTYPKGGYMAAHAKTAMDAWEAAKAKSAQCPSGCSGDPCEHGGTVKGTGGLQGTHEWKKQAKFAEIYGIGHVKGWGKAQLAAMQSQDELIKDVISASSWSTASSEEILSDVKKWKTKLHEQNYIEYTQEAAYGIPVHYGEWNGTYSAQCTTCGSTWYGGSAMQAAEKVTQHLWSTCTGSLTLKEPPTAEDVAWDG